MQRDETFNERRSEERISCHRPMMFKVCKEETLSKIMEGYTQDVSNAGTHCLIPEKIPIGSTLWVMLDRDALSLCHDLEKNVVFLQHGILGKVVWVTGQKGGNFDVGLQFITRREKIF